MGFKKAEEKPTPRTGPSSTTENGKTENDTVTERCTTQTAGLPMKAAGKTTTFTAMVS